MAEDVIPLENIVKEQREACLDHASDLLNSAARILGDDSQFPNIAYHLVLLAFEEIGKSQFIISRSVMGRNRDTTWIDKKLDDHVFKLLWAIWSPTMFSGTIEPSRFEEARKFAVQLHSKRLKGLYVDHVEATEVTPPSQMVTAAEVQSVSGLARTALDLERCKKPLSVGGPGSDFVWFLETVGDEQSKTRLFSRPFVEKLNELGDGQKWVTWARREFKKIAAEEENILKRELARERANEIEMKPKWLLHIRFISRWHTARQKVLDRWNSQVRFAQLFTTNNSKNGEFIMKLSLNDNVKADEIFDVGLMQSKFILLVLNIGSAGYFWYTVSNQSETYAEKIEDVTCQDLEVKISRPRGLSSLHMIFGDSDNSQRRDSLQESYMNNALKCLLVYSKLPQDAAEPIFGPYLFGLSLISKCDIHLSCEGIAAQEFLKCLRVAMRHYGDWDGDESGIVDALHVTLSELITERAHRDQIFGVLDGKMEENETPITTAFYTKRVVDIYLSYVADRQLKHTSEH